MGARIKFTGYIDIADLEEDEIDLDNSTGLSAKGYDAYTSMDAMLKVSELEDLEVVLEDES